MEQNFLGKAIKLISGSCSYDTDGSTIIKWRSPDVVQPSQETIDAKITELQTEYDANQFQRDRTYPELGEQMDMQYHDSVDGTTTWKDAIAKVKSDNPKPE